MTWEENLATSRWVCGRLDKLAPIHGSQRLAETTGDGCRSRRAMPPASYHALVSDGATRE